MQLSRRAVGRAVLESRVDSGALTRHPIKRTRTTLTYLLLALFGDERERLYLRREVNRQHRQVRSAAGAEVAYDAFDPELQLWVAACLYRGAVDAVAFLEGTPSPEVLDELYRLGARFATTLQVPASRWPVDRAAFDAYWDASLALIETDDQTREYLRGIVGLTFLPRPLAWALGPAHRFVTTGFLPPLFREELGLDWDERRQRRFDTWTHAAAALWRGLPRPVREFPLNFVLFDARRRVRRGQPIV
jgi:uncharacterized protein (DUF2236 family)